MAMKDAADRVRDEEHIASLRDQLELNERVFEQERASIINDEKDVMPDFYMHRIRAIVANGAADRLLVERHWISRLNAILSIPAAHEAMHHKSNPDQIRTWIDNLRTRAENQTMYERSGILKNHAFMDDPSRYESQVAHEVCTSLADILEHHLRANPKRATAKPGPQAG